MLILNNYENTSLQEGSGLLVASFRFFFLLVLFVKIYRGVGGRRGCHIGLFSAGKWSVVRNVSTRFPTEADSDKWTTAATADVAGCLRFSWSSVSELRTRFLETFGSSAGFSGKKPQFCKRDKKRPNRLLVKQWCLVL